MNVRRTAGLLDLMGRILRELPADVEVLDIFVSGSPVTGERAANVHLTGGITTLADFYGQPIESGRMPGSKYTEYAITVDGVKLFMLKKNHERTMSHE